MKKILFNPASVIVEKFLDKPRPLKNNIPQWYKDSDSWIGGKMFGRGYNPDIKLCMSFYDALTAGYSVELFQDIYVSKDIHGNPRLDVSEQTPLGPPANMLNREMNHKLPIPEGFHHQMYTWNLPFSVITPKGYSTMWIHPLNRFDLPFYSTSGIVDSDGFSLNGNLPFYIKKDFEGIIPKGTPIIQVIPLKRDSWISSVKEYDDVANSKLKYLMRSSIYGVYKRMFWQKKEYK